MKKAVIISILSLILLDASCLAGPAVLVLDEIEIPYFGKTLEGFESTCSHEMERFNISKLDMATTVKFILEKRPGLVYIRGVQSLKKVIGLTEIPVVYSLAMHPGEIIGDRPNFAGVGLLVPEEIKFEILRTAMPAAERVGVIYSGKSSLEETGKAAEKFGFKIVARKLYEIDNFSNLLKALGNKMDVFLMAPNLDVYRKKTVRELFEYTREHMIPVVTYNERFLEMGALMSVHPGPKAMGSQAGNMANRILEGAEVGKGLFEAPGDIFVKINPRTVVRLGLEISKEMVRMEEEGYKGK